MFENEMNKEQSLILVVGPDGVGKESFCKCFKNSFLRTFPFLPLSKETKPEGSFCSVSELVSDKDIGAIEFFKRRGYRVVCYCLFASRLVCAERRRFQGLREGYPVDNGLYRERYEDFYTNALRVYPQTDMFFFVCNQKNFEFQGVYTPLETPPSRFERILRGQKASADKIRV